MLSDLLAELRGLVSGRTGVVDGVIPPVVFVAVDAVSGVRPAAVAGLLTAAAIAVLRLAQRRPLRYALSGVATTLLATWLALRSGRAETYFLPGIVSGALTTLGILVSLVARRPLVAWTSWVARSWPLEWYWHPRVLPAYMLVTWLWAGFFATRTGMQWWLFARGNTALLAGFKLATGWPGLVALLAATYLLGRRKLVALKGPSVAQFETQAPPPWTPQPHGF
jgi:hypothetical protein